MKKNDYLYQLGALAYQNFCAVSGIQDAPALFGEEPATESDLQQMEEAWVAVATSIKEKLRVDNRLRPKALEDLSRPRCGHCGEALDDPDILFLGIDKEVWGAPLKAFVLCCGKCNTILSVSSQPIVINNASSDKKRIIDPSKMFRA